MSPTFLALAIDIREINPNPSALDLSEPPMHSSFVHFKEHVVPPVCPYVSFIGAWSKSPSSRIKSFIHNVNSGPATVEVGFPVAPR